MRVAVVTESFLPQVNGVTNSVLRICEQLPRHGGEVLVVAPGPGPGEHAGARVLRTPAVPLPGYAGFRVGRPWSHLARTLREFRPDVVHLASPAVLGAQAAWTARRLGIPVVAVHQTDLARFSARYGVARADRVVWGSLRRLYGAAACTLAPSRPAVAELRARGIPRVRRWARGVDTAAFSPEHRDDALRRELAPGGEVLVGYVGRLANEKEVHLLAALRALPGVRLVVVGDGPQRTALEQLLPEATFAGLLRGQRLGRTLASLDLFVHTGSAETFCQAAQEALASGVPVVAPAAGGLLDLVAEGRTGALFAPGDATGLRERVRQLAGAPEQRAWMGRAARASVRHRSWEAICQELVGHYADAVGGAAGRPPAAETPPPAEEVA